MFAGKCSTACFEGRLPPGGKTKSVPKKVFSAVIPVLGTPQVQDRAGPSSKFITYGKKTSCISSLRPYEIFQVAFSSVLSTRPCLCLFLSVALLAKSAFPGNAACLGSAVLGEGDVPPRAYGEAAGLWDREDTGLGSGWSPWLGCTSSGMGML